MKIEEAYCSFEVARLLKEKGFDEQVHAWHNTFDKVNLDFEIAPDAPHLQIPCPTHQMAMRWLREVYGIMINIVYKKIYADLGCSPQYIGYWHFNDKPYHYYEDAVEAALKYCLENLI